MIIGSEITKFFDSNLTKDQVKILFNITELQYKWFCEYYPNIKINFSDLLKRNHFKVNYFIAVDLLDEYDEEVVTQKLNKMMDAYISLHEISKLNRKKSIIRVI